MSRQLLYYSYWHTLLRKISNEYPPAWVTRSIDTYIWIECLEQYLKSLWREVTTSALLRVDQRWFENHKTLCVALKILLNLFFHEFWQIDTDCLAAFRHILSKKYCPLDVSATCMRIFNAILIWHPALAVRSELHNFDWGDFKHRRVRGLIWALEHVRSDLQESKRQHQATVPKKRFNWAIKLWRCPNTF